VSSHEANGIGPNPAAPGSAAGIAGGRRRARLKEALLGELAARSPAATMRFMRHWPAGRLSLIHLNVISILDADGPLPMRGLAETLDVSQASATGIVDRMEQRGLVERQRDEADRRIIRVALTDDGRRLIAGIATERRDHFALILDELTDEELKALLVGTRAMRRARERFHARHGHPDARAVPESGNSDPARGPGPVPTPRLATETSR
jgi:DNA-binding MarR family transcriptional regulator